MPCLNNGWSFSESYQLASPIEVMVVLDFVVLGFLALHGLLVSSEM